MFSSVPRKGGGRKEALLRMKNGYNFKSRLVDRMYVFRIITRKARTEEINYYWYIIPLKWQIEADAQ